MAYNKFHYKTVGKKLGLTFEYNNGIFTDRQPLAPRPSLIEWIKPDENYPLTSEIARRELLISAVFKEFIYQTGGAISVFSGEFFDVDPSLGLNGEVDYLITLGKAQIPFRSPVIAVAEAKQNNLLTGVGQCVAEMYAARIYNQREGTPTRRIFGTVTTGTLWGFLVLEDQTVKMDGREYSLESLPEILGILVYMSKNF